jgi:hypothetical protein
LPPWLAAFQIHQDRHDLQAMPQPKLHVVLPDAIRHPLASLGLDLDVDEDSLLPAEEGIHDPRDYS